MQVSLETTSGLERRLTVGVPADLIDSEVNKRLQQAAKDVRINGFRKGKVPMKIVRQRFGAGVRQEVLGDAINRTFQEAIQKESVVPAGQPRIEPKQFEEGKDFEYVAVFEVYPEIELKGIEGVEVKRQSSDIEDSDIDEMIENLRKNQAGWGEVERAAADGDRVNIDFTGTKDGEAFDGGSAQGHNLVLGSNTMIPGFEEGIVGMSAGEEKVLPLTFPEEYQVESLKGAATEFTVKVNSVSEQQLPELNEDFFKAFGVEEGGEDKFRAEVKDNMEREKDKITKNKVKTQVLDALLEANEIDIPQALITGEIQALRQQTMQQYGQLDSKLDVQSLLPDELFKERAEKRTALGLLISEVVKKEKISVDQDRVNTMLDSVASTYEDSQSVINYYRSNPQMMANIEAAVLEEQVVDHLLASASIVDETVPYSQLIKNSEEESASEE